MEIKYRWERNEAYMLVDAGQTRLAYYQVKMLEHNNINGLLKVRLQQMNQSSELCYVISGRQTMTQKFGNSCISVDQIRQLMAALNQTAAELETYLLDMDNLLLDPSFIFWRDENASPEFCYYPEEKPEKPFRENLRVLFRYLLNKADHQDSLSVTVVYGLYQISVKDTFRMQDCMQFLFYHAEQAPCHPKDSVCPDRTVGDLWEPGGKTQEEEDGDLEWGMATKQQTAKNASTVASQKAMAGRRTASKQNVTLKRKNITKQKAMRQPEKTECLPAEGKGKKQLWLDRVLVLVIVVLAVAAVRKVLSGRYGWQGNSSGADRFLCVLLVGFILLISVAVIVRLYGGRIGLHAEKMTQEQDQDQAADHMWSSYSGRQTSADRHRDMDPVSEDEAWSGQCQPDWKRPEGVRTNVNWPEEIWPDQPDVAAGGFWFRYQGEKNVRDFFLDGETTRVVIGKERTPPDIGLHWSTVSRRHALLQIRNGICTIQDCDSTNGTYVDGVRLQAGQSKILLPGAQVRFADLVFQMEPAGQGEEGTQVLRCGDDFGKII